MLFNDVEAQSIQGNPLPKDAQGIYLANFTDNLSQFINLVPDIDDQGAPQTIRRTTTIMDPDFYEFADGSDQIEDTFNTSNIPPCKIRLRRKPQDGVMIPCRIRTTIFFTAVVAGDTEKLQRSKRIRIQ